MIALILILKLFTENFKLDMALSAGSIFSHYLGGESLEEIQRQLSKNHKSSQKKKRCCWCCKKKRWCSSMRGNKVGSNLDYVDGENKENRKKGCCWFFKCGSKRKKKNTFHEEEWHEDLSKLKETTPIFQDWLGDTFKTVKKGPERQLSLILRMKKGVKDKSLLPPQGSGHGSVVSLPGLAEEYWYETKAILADMDSWDFDTFRLQDKSYQHSLLFVSNEIFRLYDFRRKFKIKSSNLKNLLKALEAGYVMNKNPYHNDRHASDVVQTVHAIICRRPGFYNLFTDLEIFAVFFGAMIHDLAHPGTTNNFQINAQTHLALLYNDRSVLENHHLSSAFLILKNPTCNILENLKPEEYKEFRENVIEMVLATDLASHFQNIKTVREFLKTGSWDGTSRKAISTTLSLVLHAADIANPAKPWEIHKRCSDLLMAESLAQGVQEKKLNLPVSPLCDPKDQSAATSILFIEVIVQPTLTALGDLLDMITSNEIKDQTFLEVKKRDKRRKRGTITQASDGNIPIMRNTRKRTGSSSGRKSNEMEQMLFYRPWLQHLQTNILKWRELQRIEAPVQLIKTRSEQVYRKIS